MPKISLKSSTQITTRNQHTKVETEFTVMVDGRELPNMDVIGGALEKAIEVFQAEVTKSYEVVPVRVDTPIADPYAPKTTTV